MPIGHPHKNVDSMVGNKGLKLREKTKDGVSVIGDAETQVKAETIGVRRELGTDSVLREH